MFPLAVPFRGELMHPEDVNPAAKMPAMTLSMTFLWRTGSVTMPPALTCISSTGHFNASEP